MWFLMQFMMSSFFSPTATGSVWPHLALPTVQIVAFALPPFKYRSHIFLPTVLALIFSSWSNLFTESLDIRVFLVAQWPWYLGTLNKLIFHPTPEEKYWRSDKPQREATTLPFLSKLKWSAALYCNPRGIGWNYQVKGVPEYVAPDTKARFLIQQAKRLAVCFIFMDAFYM